MRVDSGTREKTWQSVFVVTVFSLGHFFHDIYTAFISPILPILRDQFSLSYTALGVIPVITRIPSLFNPIFGFLTERYRVKMFVILSPLFTATFVCFMGNAPNYAVLLLLAFAAGTSSCFFHVPAPVLLRRAAPRRTGSAMAAFQIGGELARTAGPLIVLVAVLLWGVDHLYYLLPFAGIVSISFGMALKKLPDEKRRSRDTMRGSITATVRSAPLFFLGIFGLMLQKSFTATVLRSYMPVSLYDHGHSYWFAVLSLSVLQGAAVLGVTMTGTLSDGIGRWRVLCVLSGIIPVLMVLFTHTRVFESGPWFFAMVALLGIFSFSSTPVILSMVQRHGFRYPSIANGIYMTLSFMVSSLVILIAGKMSDLFTLETMFRVCSYISFVGLPFVFLMPRDKEKLAEKKRHGDEDAPQKRKDES